MSNLQHGMYGTRFHRIYRNIVSRCRYPYYNSYELYGGKGIVNEWKSFEDFRDSMHISYIEHCNTFGEKNTSIDRIDGSKNYFRENCRWTTPKQQARNTRRNRLFTINGETKCLAEWCDFFKIKSSVVQGRIDKHNWSVVEAFTIPIIKHGYTKSSHTSSNSPAK